MTKEKVLTGFPSVDKPWMQYYRKEFANVPLPENTIYRYLMEQNQGHTEDIALIYYGKKISYGELFRNIDTAAKILSSMGVRENDRSLYLLPNIPETAYLLYGGSKIGAVSDYIDPRPDSVDIKVSAQKVLNIILEEKIRHIVALDQCYIAMLRPVEKELKEQGIDQILIVSASDSMDIRARIHYLFETKQYCTYKELREKLRNQKRISDLYAETKKTTVLSLLSYSELAARSHNVSFEEIPYRKGRLEIIVHTSGTSGKPKPIPLSNDNLNAYVHQTFGANMPTFRRDRTLHILPYFAAFGIVNVVHAGLCHGNCLIEIPEFMPRDLGKMIRRHRVQTFIGAPAWFVSLPEDPALRKADLSFMTMLTYGGDSLNAEQEEKLNRFLREHKCRTSITKGHGMSETCGCASFATGTYNRPGNVGIPLPDTIYALINPETRQLLAFEDEKEFIEGELMISSPTVTNGILDGKTIVPHIEMDGIDYICTKDIARMYRDGSMTFLSRSDRSFTRYDGYKVKPYEIEAIIRKNRRVKDCVVASFEDETKHGKMPVAHIILKEHLQEYAAKVDLAKEIIQDCFIDNPEVSSRQIPAKIRFCDDFPISKNSKLNYKALDDFILTGEEVTVSCEETNIVLGEIKIF